MNLMKFAITGRKLIRINSFLTVGSINTGRNRSSRSYRNERVGRLAGPSRSDQTR